MVINCFLYTLINTSSRVVTDNAINIEAILHAKSLHKGKVYTGPKSSGLKIPMVPCRTSAPFLLSSESFKRRCKMVVYREEKEGPKREPSCNHTTFRFLKEPAVKEEKKACEIQIGLSRTMDLSCSVPPVLPKVF